MSEERIVRCVYCGAEMEETRSNNPWDNGLHPEYDKYTDENPRYCCSKCNIITGINRAFADMIHAKGTYTNNEADISFRADPTYVAIKLRQEADYLEKHADELRDYYIKQHYLNRREYEASSDS